jgi:PAS domain S-box-containing protein
MTELLPPDALISALSECEAEPVHIPARIQTFGALFVVGGDLTIRNCGGLVEELCGGPAAEVVGSNLGAYLPAHLTDATRVGLGWAERQPGRHFPVGQWIKPGNLEQRSILVHHHDGRHFVEVVRWNDDDGSREIWLQQPRPDELITNWIGNLADAMSFEAYLTQLAGDLQRLSNYDRVLIYRFDEMGHGEVVAEGKAPHLTGSYLHHRFPASDIPRWSRELYLRNPYRVVADVLAEPDPLTPACDPETGDPIDLSYAVLRAVPVVHRQYLINIGVRASFVVPVVEHGRLWGLIACHHSRPRLPGQTLRRLGGIAADLISTRIGYLQTQDRFQFQERTGAVLRRLEESITDATNFWPRLVEPDVGLAELLQATGLAVVGPEGRFTSGRVPPEARLGELVSWLTEHGQPVVVTPTLGQLNPAFADLAGVAAGLLALSIGDGPDTHWFLAFRPEATPHPSDGRAANSQTATPPEPARLAPLTPERSFALWRELVRGVAPSWPPALVEIAHSQLRPALLRLALAASRARARLVEERLRLIEMAVENLGEAVMITDAEIDPPGPRIIYVNPATEVITGYRREEMIGRNPRFLQGPQTDRNTLDRIRRHLRRGEPINAELINYRKDGTSYWVEVHIFPVRDATGRVTHFAAIERDVTERKQLQTALAESNRLYRMLTESMRDVIAYLGADGRLLYVTPSVTNLLGWTPEEMTSSDSVTFAHPDDQARLRQGLTANLAGETGVIGWRCRRKDGSYVWLESTCSPLREAGGAIIGAICCTRDIEERKRFETERAQSRKLEAIGQLAGGIAHDFNNLLTVINGTAELLLAELDPDSPQGQLLQQIVEAGRRGALLTSGLLTLARRHVRQPVALDVNEQVRRFGLLLSRLVGEDIAVTLDLDPQTGAVEIDPREIDQLLLNLAVNARDAMPKGGQLVIRTGTRTFVPGDRLPHPDAQPRAYTFISVRDTGSGIPEDLIDRVFEPFFTTKPEGKGTGLGLATVYGIVRQSGGFITVESRPGQGTTFTLFLPRVESAASPTRRDRSESGTRPGDNPTAARETILVVEDEPSVRRFMQFVLQKAGYEVRVVENGREAIRLSETGTPCPGLIITDVVLSDLSGPDLVTELTRRWPHPLVLFTSGYTAERLPPLESLPYRARFLSKPFDKTTLLGAVRQALDRGEVNPPK